MSPPRILDLAIAVGKKGQSPRTGFFHFFPSDEKVLDTIPLFENFCYAFALIRHRSVDSVLEGKNLLERLLAFQAPEGNFPLYLHEFPRCYDRWMGLKIAPLLVQILKNLSQGLGETKDSMKGAIERILRFSAQWERPPLWEHRFQALLGNESPFSPKGPDEWYHWLVSEQLMRNSICAPIPYHTGLQVFLGGAEVQEREEPKISALEWVLAESAGLSQRLLRVSPAILASTALSPVDLLPESPALEPFPWVSDEAGVRLFWGGGTLHSLSAPKGTLSEGQNIVFTLSEPFEGDKKEVVEAALFCNLSEETEIFIGGERGSVFQLGDTVTIRGPLLRLEIQFSCSDLEAGVFCGQISRANRPAQIACKGDLLYEAFDWRIALRTLRRVSPCQITAKVLIFSH